MSEKEKIDLGFFNMLNANIEFFTTPQVNKTCGMLNQNEVRFLRLISDHNLRTVSDLAKQLKMSKSAISQFLEKLVKKNYLIRENDTSDRRKVYIRLTALGNAIMSDYHRCQKKLIKKIITKLNAKGIDNTLASEIFKITETAIKEYIKDLEET